MEGNSAATKEIENYLDTIRFLNESTDDYFFVWDIRTGRVHFAGEIYNKYPLLFNEKEGNSIEEWKSIVYARDLKIFENQVELMSRGSQESCSMEYRIVDNDGNKKWICCKGKSKFDENGAPCLVIGCISGNVPDGKADSLTGLLNANRFMEDMMACLEEKEQGTA